MRIPGASRRFIFRGGPGLYYINP